MAKSNPKKQVTDADRALLDALGVDTAPTQTAKRTPKEERIIAGFEEIERFTEEQGRLPQHGEKRDIFERLYAVRLDRLRASEECRTLLAPLDARGLLDADDDFHIPATELDDAELDDAALLSALGIEPAKDGADSRDDITQLTHVRSRKEVKAAEEIARRTACENFDQFKPIFEDVQRGLETGQQKTVKFQDNAAVNQGDLFILDGQKLFIADLGELYTNKHGHPERRLRIIYDNGTESNLFLRSLQRALNKDKASRRITKPDSDLGPLFSATNSTTETADDAEPLFSGTEEADDLPSGYIYVLRSKSDHPFVAANRSIIHKIGVTGGDVNKRIANAKKDPTYLLADVEVMATVRLVTINRKKLETLLQNFFSGARLDLELQDRFGATVKPREWFLVPLDVIEEAIDKIKNGTINQFRYDLETAKLTRL